MTREQLIRMIRRQIRDVGSQAQWAADHGISGAYLNDVLQGRRDPGEKMLRPMRLERVVTYRKMK